MNNTCIIYLYKIYVCRTAQISRAWSTGRLNLVHWRLIFSIWLLHFSALHIKICHFTCTKQKYQTTVRPADHSRILGPQDGNLCYPSGAYTLQLATRFWKILRSLHIYICIDTQGLCGGQPFFLKVPRNEKFCTKLKNYPSCENMTSTLHPP